MTNTIIRFDYKNGIRNMSINGVPSVKSIKSKEEMIPFINNLTKEVNTLPIKKKKKFYNILQTTTIALIPMLYSTKKVHAQQMSNYPLLSNSKELELLPPEILDILKQLIMACETISVALAIIFLMGAGIYRMIGNKAKAREWTVDIIKGFGQILLAPVIILVLASLTALVFKNVRGLEAFF